jgi:aspartokinase/homoserine dehydrogenase 1
MIVLKFGGTSVKNSSAMKKVLSILKKRLDIAQVVVLSACSGITDTLLQISEAASKGDVQFAKGLSAQIKERHLDTAKELIPDKRLFAEATEDISSHIENLDELIDGIAILKECTIYTRSKCLAFGEYLSTALFYHYCKSEGMECSLYDSKLLIKTIEKDHEFMVDFEATNELVNRNIDHSQGIKIVQGFIATNGNGRITTFTRGGSDYSAAIFGAALDAEVIEIWTDVSGVLSADPRLVYKSLPVEKMSFDEIRELSYYGAKVLHPDTILPAMKKNIPVKILNTFSSEEAGTTILFDSESDGRINSLILNNNCPVLTNRAKLLSSEDIKKINNFITKNGLRVLFSSISDKRVFYIMDKNTDTDVFSWMLANYELHIKAYDIIILCGNGIKVTPELLSALQQTADGDFKGIFYGHSRYSMIALYNHGYGINALNQLHKELIEAQNNL